MNNIEYEILGGIPRIAYVSNKDHEANYSLGLAHAQVHNQIELSKSLKPNQFELGQILYQFGLVCKDRSSVILQKIKKYTINRKKIEGHV